MHVGPSTRGIAIDPPLESPISFLDEIFVKIKVCKTITSSQVFYWIGDWCPGSAADAPFNKEDQQNKEPKQLVQSRCLLTKD